MTDSIHAIEQQRQITRQLCQDTGARYVPPETVNAGMELRERALCVARSSRQFWEALQRSLSSYVYEAINDLDAKAAKRVA